MWKKKLGRPKNPQPKICVVDGCEVVVEAKNLCRPHYMQSRIGVIEPLTGRRLREPKRIARYADGDVCFIDGCGDRPKSRGMCNRHTIQRATGIIDEHGNQLRPLATTGNRRPPDWRAIDDGGYVVVLAPTDHPNARADGTILEHRLVMEEMIGRYLLDYEIVHHKNGIRFDNKPGNLELLDGRSARPGGPGHPPGHDMDQYAAIQTLLQQPALPNDLKYQLESYRSTIGET